MRTEIDPPIPGFTQPPVKGQARPGISGALTRIVQNLPDKNTKDVRS